MLKCLEATRPGKRLHNYGKSPFSMGKSTLSMVIFNSYVKLPEANSLNGTLWDVPQIGIRRLKYNKNQKYSTEHRQLICWHPIPNSWMMILNSRWTFPLGDRLIFRLCWFKHIIVTQVNCSSQVPIYVFFLVQTPELLISPSCGSQICANAACLASLWPFESHLDIQSVPGSASLTSTRR